MLLRGKSMQNDEIQHVCMDHLAQIPSIDSKCMHKHTLYVGW